MTDELSGPATLMLHNASRHSYSCPWGSPGVYDPATHPCTCHLLKDIRAVEQASRAERDYFLRWLQETERELGHSVEPPDNPPMSITTVIDASAAEPREQAQPPHWQHTTTEVGQSPYIRPLAAQPGPSEPELRDDGRSASVLADVASVLVAIEDGRPLPSFALDGLSSGWQRLLRHVAALAAADSKQQEGENK